MTYEEIVSKVAKSVGVDKKFVDRTYKAYWKVVNEYVSSMPLVEDLTDEEFNNLRPNVNVPSLGKLYVSLDKYKRIKRNIQKRQELKEKKYVTH